MEKYYVYFENVLIINLIVNYLILWLTARFANLSIRKKRIFAGALVGAAYSFMLLIPYLGSWVNMVTKFLVSLLMIAVAFWPLKLRKFWQGVTSLYLVTFLLGGTVFGLGYFLNDSSFIGYFRTIDIITDNLIFILAFVVCAYWLFGRVLQSFLNGNRIQEFLKTVITITFAEKSLQVEALLDTGNHLREPISKYPVIVVEYEALKDLMPEEIRASLSKGSSELQELFEVIEKTDMATRFRVIPYKSLGEDSGLIVGFLPERLTVHKGETEINISEVIIGIYHRSLSPNGNYRALLHPEILS